MYVRKEIEAIEKLKLAIEREVSAAESSDNYSWEQNIPQKKSSRVKDKNSELLEHSPKCRCKNGILHTYILWRKCSITGAGLPFCCFFWIRKGTNWFYIGFQFKTVTTLWVS